ncbi:bifunctional ADP-dependent NAD(P)H-hydrate dehydratase/NAD(P)H-hydrate epimerase [Cellulomonas fengjieae]|uniref:bifunctional ADP-dependent NAD(P)H-hydrate dehydratase/NAD(P)H-hydrate epimerase n=1 Tax=Cellulomonas fengjieae TaxID=2819978 RepID=UPI001AAFFF6C|nr:bifunctional ADP-dependent NAD(P)H-hydrate dehydratase/NAD(P)H-hydrate epimerase [Cellulomonas fengjieae]MBO3101651.1 bifunctional ADP-dependent NAD(P)H-hydrate dehydratase/NAD(P)H-hydrate epimerase [Cellulomonas fengjieae]
MRNVLQTWTSAQVRAAEEPLLAAGVPLMGRAAFALHVWVADALRDRRGTLTGARVVVLVGPGNNGGDALHAGALLARRGVEVHAVLTADRVHQGGLTALRAAGGRVLRLERLEDAAALAVGADLVLDGVLGIGSDGSGLRGAAGALVEAIVQRGRPYVVAVDVPSGLGVDDGRREGVVLDADLTVSFGTLKPGLVLPPGARAAGRVEHVDLGLEPAGAPAVVRLEAADVADLWPVPAPDAHKYTRGVVGVVAGSRAYAGAAVLTTSGAVRAGVGMVRYLGDVADLVVAAHPEVVVGHGRVQAWVFGPGVSPDDAGQRRRIEYAVQHVRERGEPAVVDAGALDLLPPHVGPHAVITPHAGELARLLGQRGEAVDRADVEAEPLRWARRAHELTGATVLLKGPVTVVVGARGAVYAQADAPPWLATAGAGDVFAGLLGALLAGRAQAVQEDPSLAAALAAAAALVHGRAAHRANPGGPVAAQAVADALPGTIAELLGA